jgi:hypothetical protein
MQFYIHKETGKPIAILGTLFQLDCENSTGRWYNLLYKAIYPHRPVGNGIEYHVISRRDLLTYYKRINKKVANELVSDWGQLRHFNDKTIEWCSLKDVKKSNVKFGI